jgi:hypothetical protein
MGKPRLRPANRGSLSASRAPIWGLYIDTRHPHCQNDDYFGSDCIGGYWPAACCAGAGASGQVWIAGS